MENIFLILITLFTIYLIGLINLNRNKCKEIKANIALKEYKINMNLKISSDIIEELDKFIHEIFMEYITLNIEFRGLEYITPELEDIIVREVGKRVVEELSPVFFDKLALVYNKNNFTNFISKRVYLHTLNYTITKNSIKEDKK